MYYFSYRLTYLASKGHTHNKLTPFFAISYILGSRPLSYINITRPASSFSSTGIPKPKILEFLKLRQMESSSFSWQPRIQLFIQLSASHIHMKQRFPSISPKSALEIKKYRTQKLHQEFENCKQQRIKECKSPTPGHLDTRFSPLWNFPPRSLGPVFLPFSHPQPAARGNFQHELITSSSRARARAREKRNSPLLRSYIGPAPNVAPQS